MHDPNIQQYQRPVYIEEDQDDQLLGEKKFFFGVAFFSTKDKSKPIVTQIPETIGRFISKVFDMNNSHKDEGHPAVLCSTLFTQTNQEIKAQIDAAIHNGYCADVRDTVVAGNFFLGYRKQAELIWQPCGDRTDDDKPECMPINEQEKWLDEAKLEVYFIYSFNFVDFNAFDDDEPFKHSAAMERLSKNLLRESIDFKSNLLLHEASFDDDLIDPFGLSQKTQEYLSTSSFEITVEEMDSGGGGKKRSQNALFELELKTRLDGYLQVESRIRKSYWDLLGDVGGFNDGCFLLCSIFMGLYSQIVFQSDYLDGTLYENEKSKQGKAA